MEGSFTVPCISFVSFLLKLSITIQYIRNGGGKMHPTRNSVPDIWLLLNNLVPRIITRKKGIVYPRPMDKIPICQVARHLTVPSNFQTNSSRTLMHVIAIIVIPANPE